MAADREIAALLSELGFRGPDAQRIARSALDAASLTNPRKTRVSEEKLGRIREFLGATFVRSCSDGTCRSSLERSRPGRTLVTVERTSCENCGGSDNLKAIRRLAELCRPLGIARVVVVGGSPSVRAELLELKPPEWELRLIDGTERRTQDKAKADLEWAQLVFVWGSSELDHRVSRLYTDAPGPHRRKIVLIAKRGIAALLNAGADHVGKIR